MSEQAQNLEEMVNQIDQLPLLPQVLLGILDLDPNAEDFFAEFSKLVEVDPPLAVRVLALANSAANAAVNPIVNLQAAITRLGSTAMSSFVTTLAVQKVFVPTSRNQTRLWGHSVACAVAARYLAGIMPTLKVDPETAYVCGLLHDVGRFVMFEHADERLQAVDEFQWQSADDLIAADIAVFTYTHSELGYRACRNWGLPERIAKVVLDHHTPAAATTPVAASIEATTACIRLADRLCITVLEADPHSIDADDLTQLLLQDVLVTDSERQWFDPAALGTEQIAQLRTEIDWRLAG